MGNETQAQFTSSPSLSSDQFGSQGSVASSGAPMVAGGNPGMASGAIGGAYGA